MGAVKCVYATQKILCLIDYFNGAKDPTAERVEKPKSLLTSSVNVRKINCRCGRQEA